MYNWKTFISEKQQQSSKEASKQQPKQQQYNKTNK